MRCVHRLSGFMIVALVYFASVQSADAQDKEPAIKPLKGYLLDSGDKISIKVFDEADLSLDVVISDSGSISYPFLGEVKTKGISIGDLEQKIISGLKGSYLVDPKVTITMIQYRQFFIHGEVKQSGGYPYQPGLTLRKAISVAGGFTERAAKSKVSVIRDGGKEKQSVGIGMDDLVHPGDTITVEQSFF